MAPTRQTPFLEQLYYHVALPRNVPGREDGNLRHIEEILLTRLIDATSQLYPHALPRHQPYIRGLQETLFTCKALNVDGTIPRSALLREMSNFDAKTCLVLHATAQNCALLAYRDTNESGKHNVVFEAFEASASCSAVLGSRNSLIWDFPGSAVTIPFETFSESSFQESIAAFMERASTEVILRFSAEVVKATKSVPEVRDTSAPDFVSGLLMTILEANGAVHPVKLLRKRVRDTVSWDNSYKPWRRSPFYLVVRVAIQRYLYHHHGPEVGRLHYKFIMCIMMSRFLEEAFKSLPLEAAAFLLSKLGRRIAKLESDISSASQSSAQVYAHLFKAFETSFQHRLKSIGHYLKKVSKNNHIEREIPPLRSRAFDAERNLVLKNSRGIIMEILAHKESRPTHQARPPLELLEEYEQSVASVKPYMEAVKKHILTSQYLEDVVIPAKNREFMDEQECIDLSKTIREFVNHIKASVHSYPDQLSHKLLHLMELWVLMDEAAVFLFPLLQDFHPSFEPDILDPIQLLALEDMSRVQEVQRHLIERCQLAGGKRGLTIFSDPSDECFAARFYDNSDMSEELFRMRDKIEEDAKVACVAKEKEWEEKYEWHRKLIDKRDSVECQWHIVRTREGFMESRHKWPCEWHNFQDAAKSIKINIHEHPLPSYEPAVKVTLFELHCPKAFAAYRDATWSILSLLCQPSVEIVERVSLSREYSQLRPYANDTQCQVTLGSAKKAHLECHYATWGFPISLEQVCRTCGLQPRYFDNKTHSWTDNVASASFFHHFPVLLPNDSPYRELDLRYACWPSSNEIQASQAVCPADVSIHEFLAWQGLLVGTHSRWFDLLRELGSSNLNFSADSTWVIVQRLILQIGPATSIEDPLRDVHSALQDRNLCQKLLEQVHQKLEAIHRNWREPIQMSILISILLKIISLSNSDLVLDQANRELSRAREICSTWRTELWSIITEDPKTVVFLIWAGLLCKRTMHLDRSVLLKPETLRQFIDSSIVVHYALTADFTTLQYPLRNAIVRDCLFTYDNGLFIRDAILANPSTFFAAVNSLWHTSEALGTSSELEHALSTPWIFFTLSSPSQQLLHSVHYNYRFGTLLIDGQEMRALPAAYRSHPIYQRMFDQKNPNVLPSALSGMSFCFAESIRDHRIHLGFRNDHLVIRASFAGETLEFVPRGVFGTQTPLDLPSSLISDCFHWLNVFNGQMYIRRKDAWASKSGDWSLYGLKSGTCKAIRCAHASKETVLLDPTSGIARSIVQVFQNFEAPAHIMVFVASRDGNITAQLTRLDLSFYVNQKGLLYSPRLGSFISQNQDAGTWYGLKSKLVVQSQANNRNKSILLPLGEPRLLREGRYLSVVIESGGGLYLQFSINEVLGRIDCAPEPRLLYMKALLHAYTSNNTIDPLTQRTGVEEAIRLLKSGSYMPWKPLDHKDIQTLMMIGNLSPQRGYYPPNLKCMETVVWQPDPSISVQDERYRELVARILQRSSDLSKFSLEGPDRLTFNIPVSDPHLQARALSRTHLRKFKEDHRYESRDRRVGTVARDNVFQLVESLIQWKSDLSGSLKLVDLLQDAPVIGGYDKFFQKNLLTDLLTVNVRAEWGGLTQKSLSCNAKERYHLMFLFAPIVYSGDCNIDLMRMIISFAMIPGLKELSPPIHPAYFHFRADGTPASSYLISFMEKARIPFSEMGFKKRSQVVIAENRFERDVQNSCEKLAFSVLDQWPNPTIDREKLIYIDPAFLDTDKALEYIAPEWARLAQNHALANHLEQVQRIVDTFVTDENEETSRPSRADLSTERSWYPTRLRDRDDLTLSELLQADISSLPNYNTNEMLATAISPTYASLVSRSGNVPRNSVSMFKPSACASHQQTLASHSQALMRTPTTNKPELVKLRMLLDAFDGKRSFVQSRYKQELETSINALECQLSKEKAVSSSTSHRRITGEDIKPAKYQAISTLNHIHFDLQAKQPHSRWLQIVDLWPRMTVTDMLRELRSTSGTAFGKGTKEALVTLGLAVTRWQKLMRIHDTQKKCKNSEERDEWANQGHTNWDPLEQPDWLLLEIDGDILLREEQVEVAFATIAPSGGSNAVLQLLMGKGKTSCILPMVAAVLANKTNLCRIVVPRPLLLQSAQVMQGKLGGLVDREIIHVPFSRKTPTDSRLHLYANLHSEMKNCNGVVLTLPDHVLSFKLSGLQQLCDSNLEKAAVMIQIQNWLDVHSRDVLDECDVSLAIKTQLIYPSGSQTTVDGHPMRWQVVESLLHLTMDFAPAVKGKYPRSLEMVRRGSDGFPLLYFLRRDSEEYLVRLLIQAICKGQASSILPCAEYPMTILEDLKAYISSPTVRSQVVSRLMEFFRGKPQLMKTAHLLRGLFVHRIFITVLKKRWNVQYGLHEGRAPIAVPYLAKGVPSPSAEWGHPDVAITLTCLSFYYQGLTMIQFKQSLDHILKMDESSIEYEKWLPKGINIPKGLEDLASINVEDAWQLNELYKFLRTSISLVDFYLNNFVFPKYAKTFKLKLQASGWSLFPSLAVHRSGCRVTGFSGTNDSRHQLPMRVEQSDLAHLAHTNAEVLYYLLAPRNQAYIRMAHPNGVRWSEMDLIDRLSSSSRYSAPYSFISNFRPTERIRILIDAGAQVLEHSNLAFAKAWLKKDTNAAAAIYFDDDHRAWAVYRNGSRIPFLASPFTDHLDRCCVYLDENHCRGTDLKFPPTARAAVTLGQHLTKDALVQAAMRLRLLGQSQSVVFLSPTDCHQGILDRLKRDDSYQPKSADVLQWVIGQTCDAIEQLDPSYFAQTSQYLLQEQARLQYPDFLTDGKSREAFLDIVRVKESMSLKQLYEPRSQRNATRIEPPSWHRALKPFVKELAYRKKNFNDRGTAVHASALEEVEIEQEREVEVEVEVEVEDIREIQRPPLFKALTIRRLHKDIELFALTGFLPAGSEACQPMFSVLGRTALALKHTISSSMKSRLWVSTEFNRTVDVYHPHDNYIRPCHWLMWSEHNQKALLVSEEEANQLIPILRQKELQQAGGTVHLIVYAAPTTRRMLQFNNLNYHAIPALPVSFKAPGWLRVELGLFSGRLYLDWDEYYDLLGYLGLNRDLSVDSQNPAFAKKPLTFMHEWLSVRRNGQDFEHCPMGYVTAGKPLTENHPFFRAFGQGDGDADRPQIALATSGRLEDGQEEDDFGDHDDEFVPAVELVDDSESEDEKELSEDEASFFDAEEDLSE